MMTTAVLTDFESDVQRIEDEIRASREAPRSDCESATKYAYLLYQRASLEGDTEGLAVAEREVDTLIPRVRYPEDLYLLKANIAFKLHRLTDVERCLNSTPATSRTAEALKLQADLLFQQGRYADARRAYEDAIASDRTWDNLARYAHFISKFEDSDAADALYIEAEDELTSKQMRSYAWLELQRGLLDARAGRYDDALAHYRRAEQAYSGYWMVDEHMARLFAAQGQLAEAAALYEDVLDRCDRPETIQALGSVYKALGKHDLAATFFARALARYLESAERGEVHYYHHLVDYHCAVTRDAAEAVRWARLDLELRCNFSTQAALAWALYLTGAVEESAVLMNTALASGVRDAHLLSHAEAIYRATHV